MMQQMRKAVLFIIIIIPILFGGCTHDMNRKEIDEINFIHVMGIDYKDGEYTVSALYSSSGGADPESGGGPGKEEITEGKGKSPYQAMEDIRLKNKKTISVANTGYFLIGDEAARNGIKECLDFLSRDETIKMEALIYVVQNSSALDFLKQGLENKQTIHEDLKAVEQKQLELVTRNDNTLVNILNEMRQTYSSVLVPYLVSEAKSFLIKGYSVFDQLKLKDYLDQDTSSGVNFIKDIIRVYPIYLEDNVGLSLSYSKTKLKSKLNGNRVKITVKVDFETMIKEVTGQNEVFTRDGLKRLTEEENEYIQRILEKAVNYSVTTGLDILQIARLVENEHVAQWKELEQGWTESVSDIQYEYVIQSKVAKSFILGEEKK
jgi:spore germination protein KC